MESATVLESIAARAFSVVTTVVAPATLIAALLTYFGWTRTGAIYAYYGIDQAVLGLSIQDYLIRSGSVVFMPAAIVVAAVAAAVLLDLAIGRASSGWPVQAFLTWMLAAIGATLAAIGLATASALPIAAVEPMLGACLMGSGALILAIAIRHSGMPNPSRLAATITVAGLFLIALFWVTSIYASESGTHVADDVNRNPGSRPEITIFSNEPLDFGPSSTATLVARPDGGNSYRYSGMRLFSYANDRWFLIPGKRQGDRLPIHVLHDADSVSVAVHAS